MLSIESITKLNEMRGELLYSFKLWLVGFWNHMIFAELKENIPYSKSTQIELSSNLACEFHVLA